MDREVVLKLKYIKKIYKAGELEVKALDNVNMEIEKGEFVAIIGESGSGKSTMLNLLGGLDTATFGDIYVNNKKISELDDNQLSTYRRDEVGFIFQYFNLIPYFNVIENIILPLRIAKRKVNEEYLEKILKVLGLDKRQKHLPSELSGGQQQRVAIARALINKPKIILADEPTGNLDIKNSKEVMKLLSELAKQFNQTIVMVTHDLSITNYAERVITMADGKIISNEVVEK